MADALKDKLLCEKWFSANVYVDHVSHLFLELFLLCHFVLRVDVHIEFICIVNMIELAWFSTSFFQPDFLAVLPVCPSCFGSISPSQQSNGNPARHKIRPSQGLGPWHVFSRLYCRIHNMLWNADTCIAPYVAIWKTFNSSITVIVHA